MTLQYRFLYANNKKSGWFQAKTKIITSLTEYAKDYFVDIVGDDKHITCKSKGGKISIEMRLKE